LTAPWDDPFILEWLALPPKLGASDLRGILYVSREHAPLITPEDRLSSEGAELLTAVLENPDVADKVRDKLAALPRPELGIIMDRIIDQARREREWGTPPILTAALTVGAIDQNQGSRLAAFLSGLPATTIKASIVPKIADQTWSKRGFCSMASIQRRCASQKSYYCEQKQWARLALATDRRQIGPLFRHGLHRR
jgi:predicted KAP-like P-loop ATPase